MGWARKGCYHACTLLWALLRWVCSSASVFRYRNVGGSETTFHHSHKLNLRVSKLHALSHNVCMAMRNTLNTQCLWHSKNVEFKPKQVAWTGKAMAPRGSSHIAVLPRGQVEVMEIQHPSAIFCTAVSPHSTSTKPCWGSVSESHLLPLALTVFQGVLLLS